MTLESLARIGRLQPHATTREEIRKLLTGAARSLKDAGNTANSDATKLTLAYTAIMEAAQAALFANGFRPSKSEGGHHMTLVQGLPPCSSLAARWNSPLLVEVNERTLGKVLAQPGLLEKLEQIEDFRALAKNAKQVVTSTQKLNKAKREQGGELDQDQKREQAETAKQRKEIREKLQKFLAKIPVFMYVTDFREEALKDVIESLDSALFERVTGLTIEDFKLLSGLGLFNAQHMNAAIYQFRSFENASLHYADEAQPEPHEERIGLWDKSVFGRVADDPATEEIG